jgi:hypothetical protein
LSSIDGRRDANEVFKDCCEMLLIAEAHVQSDVENGETGICNQLLTPLDAEPKHVLVGALVRTCAKLK